MIQINGPAPEWSDRRGMNSAATIGSVPGWIAKLLQAVPTAAVALPLEGLALSIMRRHRDLFDRMGPYGDARFLIDVLDIPFQFYIHPRGRIPLRCVRKPGRLSFNARIAGQLGALLATIQGERDGDALFFSRDITVEGDTDAVLALRNAIDAAELDLQSEIVGPFGPCGTAMRNAQSLLRPLLKKLPKAIRPAAQPS